MAAKCNKFLPNIFNKSKCQHCFAAKEAHSAEALENNKASRKVSKCGYLFVSPGFDFNNPLDRTRRWQRRFFILYDDGEFSYSVDENPDTIPQGTVDMNKCTDVLDAEKTTTHTNSLAIVTPDKTLYIKGNSKEEIQWWSDILAEFPKALKAIKPRRKQPYLILSNKENMQPDTVDGGSNATDTKQGRFEVKGRPDGPAYATFRGVRSLKHKYDSNHQEGLRKSSSLHDLSSEGPDLQGTLESSRFLSRSGDRLDILSRDSSFTPASQRSPGLCFTMPRSTWTRTGQPVPPTFLPPKSGPVQQPASAQGLAPAHFNSSSSISSTSSTNSSAVPRRGSFDDRPAMKATERGGRVHRERSSSLKDFPTQLSVARDGTEEVTQHNMSADETDSNETDELKMARSSELNATSRALSLASSSAVNPDLPVVSKYEDLVYMKKGWLIKQAPTEKESRKHWFVLAGNSLRYYKDAKAEEANMLDGRIDLSSCYEVSEIATHRNYGFKVKEEYPTQEDTDHDEIGSATTSDVVAGDEALVEILETEVESLKDRLEFTQTELDKVHQDNIDLKSRLHKDQSVDSGYSTTSRWAQSTNQSEQGLKRQLKESREIVQRQRLDIEGLKSKLDMSVSKLTGTEKALSEALRDYKQEKDKFLKVSSEWNRRIRSMETQSKENLHKLERSRESLQAKERECRRLEAEVKANSQRTREQEREILKLKAVEHEYNQLKEKLDDRDHELCQLRSELKEKDYQCKKLKEDCEHQLEELESDYSRERDDLENHVEHLKSQLYSAHDRQSSMADDMTYNMADILREKDDIIAQLEEKMIEADKKLVDFSEELHAEMGENADLAHNIEILQDDKLGLSTTIDHMESQLMGIRTKLSGFESENLSLRKQLEDLRKDNSQLREGLNAGEVGAGSSQVTKEKQVLEKTIMDLNKQIKDLQTQLEVTESLIGPASAERTVSSLSSISSASTDHQHDLLHNILVADSQLKEVNTMLLTLRQNFDAYLGSLADDARGPTIALADLVEDIGRRCHEVQDTLREPQESPRTLTESDYQHAITVDASSSGKVILEEYKGLKVKFDQVVTELRTVKKNMSSVDTSYASLEKEDKKLKEKVAVMEGAYKQQIIELIGRVDNLSNRIVNVQTDAVMDTSPFSESASCDTMQQIDSQLVELGQKITLLEQQVASSSSAGVVSGSGTSLPTPPSGSQSLLVKLEDIRSQLEDINSKLQTLDASSPSLTPSSVSVPSPATFVSRIDSFKVRLSSLSSTLQPGASIPKPDTGHSSSNESVEASSPVGSSSMDCLLEIRDRIKEIGEQLDSLEEDDEDSDSDEEEGEQTTVEDVRQKLASLTEFVEQHSKLSGSDWMLLQLLTLQKRKLTASPSSTDSDLVTEEEKLKLYSDRLSLEAVTLSEMAHILQNKEHLTPEDTVCREIDSLNNQTMLLHQRLDNETKTMHFDQPQADLLQAYAKLMAEKILVSGQLCSSNLDQRSHTEEDTVNTASGIQPVILATEALLRSQIDTYIGHNLDRSAEEIITLPTHIASRALVQGELTHALSQLKSRLVEKPEVLEAGSENYQFMFDRLVERQLKVMTSLNCYEKQIIHSLAVIIWKESEEMTIVEGPESVLDAMCSELSTIMERHIQRYKEKCRTAKDTHSAHKYDIIVNELRFNREVLLSELKSQHEAYAKDQVSGRDSSLDVPVQSLDDTITNFGEIVSLKAIVRATTNFLAELLKMGDTVLSDLEMEEDNLAEDSVNMEKGLNNFVNALSEALQAEALSKEALSRKLTNGSKGSEEEKPSGEELGELVLQVPDLSHYPDHLSGRAAQLVRESVFSAQLTFSLFKQKLAHEREVNQLKVRRPVRSRPQMSGDEESHDSEDTLDLLDDFQALLVPLEEVLESKHEDELEVLQVVNSQVGQMKQALLEGRAIQPGSPVEEQLQQLEQKLHHELEMAHQRHDTHLEVFKQESGKLEKTLEEQQQDRDHYEDRCSRLEEELSTMQIQHEEEKERMKQDILTAVHAIRSNEEKSESHLLEKASRLNKELAMQKLSFRKILSTIKKEMANKDNTAVAQSIEKQIAAISVSPDEEEEQEIQPPLPSQPPPDVPDGAVSSLEEHSVELKEPGKSLDLSHHEHEVEQLKKEKEEALAEEMRNTKAALDAMRKAYEEELGQEKAKYKEALVTMYTEEYVNEIRLRHQEEEEHMREELQKLNLHYSGKCEDYKLLEMKLQQTKQDFESHISQLISSNDHLEEMLNQEMDKLKDFIKNRPSNLTTGSATVEEELYDAKIMVRVQDAELKKLRSQVKNLENSLHRTTEEQRQTMTQYMQALKTAGENKKQSTAEIAQLTEKLNKVLGSQGLKANIRRTPSFHQRARSPSPQGTSPSPRKDSDHSSRDSHRRRHIHSKDLRRSKSSPSLPYVFDGKGSPTKASALAAAATTSTKAPRRSRSPKI